LVIAGDMLSITGVIGLAVAAAASTLSEMVVVTVRSADLPEIFMK
jgi:hypothetical protein